MSILPRQPPVQLYQFGQGPAGTSAVASGGRAALGVILSQVSLPRAAIGDGVLTVRGDEAAYIAGARWLTPAVLMLQEDAQQAFEAQAVNVRLIERSQIGGASALLRLDGREFDARYDPGSSAPPVVVVSVLATLTDTGGHALQQQVFTARSPAAEDRVGPIVGAYDVAVHSVLAQVVGWADARVPVLAAGAVPDATLTPPPAAPSAPPRARERGGAGSLPPPEMDNEGRGGAPASPPGMD